MGIVCSKGSGGKTEYLRRRRGARRSTTVNITYAGPIPSGSSSRTSGRASYEQVGVPGDGESVSAAVGKSKNVVLPIPDFP